MRFPLRIRSLGAALFLAAALAVPLPAAAQQKAPPKPPVGNTEPQKTSPKTPVGNLEVTIAVKGGGAVQSCVLYLRERSVELPAGKTTYRFEGVPQSGYTLAGDAKVTGAAGAMKRHAAVQRVAVNGGQTAKVTLTLEEVESMEKFCSGCHPAAGQPSEPGQIIRDVHASGKILDEKYLGKVSRHNANAERLAKEGKPHNLPIILEKIKVDEGGKIVERNVYTCESCHTLHWSRGQRNYVRAPYLEAPDLCVACH